MPPSVCISSISSACITGCLETITLVIMFSLLIENTGFESLLLLCLQAVLTTSNMLEKWLKKEVFVNHLVSIAE